MDLESNLFPYLAIGLPLVALIASFAIGNRLRFDTVHTELGTALYTYSLFLLLVIPAALGLMLVLPIFWYLFAFNQFLLGILFLPPIVLLVGTLLKAYRLRLDRGRIAFALLAWGAVVVFWALYFSPWILN